VFINHFFRTLRFTRYFRGNGRSWSYTRLAPSQKEG
jgi:hypothetical protein